MRFSIQEQNGKKMIFHSPAEAHKVTGVHFTTIKTTLERGANPIYHRRSDNKLFEIRKEDPIRLIMIEGEDFFSLEEIQAKFGLSPTIFLNQVKNDKFAKRIDWISPELFPGGEAKRAKPDEIKILRSQFEKYQEEMRSQFEKYQTEISKFQAEIDRLSAKVETLEKEKAGAFGSLPGNRSFRRSQGIEAPRKQSQKFSILPELLTRYFSILNLWRSSSEMGLLTYALMGPKLTDMFSLTTKENIFLIW